MMLPVYVGAGITDAFAAFAEQVRRVSEVYAFQEIPSARWGAAITVVFFGDADASASNRGESVLTHAVPVRRAITIQ